MVKAQAGEGRQIDITAGGTLVGGTVLLSGSAIGVVAHDAVSGESVPLILQGEFSLAKATGAGITVLAKVYWDDTAKKCTATSAGNTLLGICTVAAASGDTTVMVRLNGISV